MQNVKTRVFIKKLQKNGFRFVRHENGSHAIYAKEGYAPLPVPIAKNEINGCMVRRWTREYNLK